jgi:hypothetical protein
VVVELVGDCIPTNKGMGDLMSGRSNVFDHVEMVALGDGVIQRVHSVECCRPLYAKHGH